ncbi:MAG TPA: hypothetical protein EYN92_03625 [Dehalococcoidia bacterium]|jgi:hypothetical protein|nr:hypothetical protein [Dehalococcoidia bacterium]
MSELNEDEIRALAKAVNIEVKDSDITDISYSLNAMLQAIDSIDPEGINAIEPLPIILPQGD